LKKVIFISVTGLVFGSYNLIKLFLSLVSETGKQYSFFMWVTHSRDPIFSKISFITLSIFAVYFYKYRDDKNWPFILAVILGGWIALNQQIVSNRIIQHGHYYFYFIVPLSIMTSFYMVWHLLKKWDIKKWNIRKYLFIAIIIVVFTNTAGGQYKSFLYTMDHKLYEQNFKPIIDYLNRDQTPAVILADQVNVFLFTIYTAHDLFWQNSASIHKVPIQRHKDALFVYYYLNTEIRNDFKGYLEKVGKDQKVRGSYYKVFFRNLEGYWSGYDYYDYRKKIAAGDEVLTKQRPEIIDRLYREYNETILKDNGINKILKKYGIEYIVWDKNNNPEWDLEGIEGVEELMSNNNIYLYSIVN